MSTQHETVVHIRCFSDCLRINRIAKECQSIVLIDRNGNQANAQSLLSMMSLDYTGKIRIIASSGEELFAVSNALTLQ